MRHNLSMVFTGRLVALLSLVAGQTCSHKQGQAQATRIEPLQQSVRCPCIPPAVTCCRRRDVHIWTPSLHIFSVLWCSLPTRQCREVRPGHVA